MMKTTFIGVGVGPGDPELLTLKAWRLITQADVISYISNVDGVSQARQIAAQALAEAVIPQTELPLCMPMCDDRILAERAYDKAAKEIASHLQAGSSVVFLCEGDALFFGSFVYLLERLQAKYSCITVPGISAPHAASAAISAPLARLQESFAVLSGRHEEAKLCKTLAEFDNVVILKAGKARPRILNALAVSQRITDACYLEYIGRDNEYIEKDISRLDHKAGPYFSLFMVTRRHAKSVTGVT